MPVYARTPVETAAGVTPTHYHFTASPLDIRRLGAVGDDSTDNATAFSQARTIASASTTPVEIVIPEGIYRISSAQNWYVEGLTLRAVGRVIIKCTSPSGAIMTFDAGQRIDGLNCRMLGEFVLDGGDSGVRIGLYTRNVHHSVFECRVLNVDYAACAVEGAVLNHYRVTCSNVGRPMKKIPAHGITIDRTYKISATTDCVFDLVIEAARDAGIVLIEANNNIFRGTSEGVGGTALVIHAASTGNLFDAFFMEANYFGGDVDCHGSGNRFVNCTASSRALKSPYEAVRSIILRTGSERNVWDGGSFYGAVVERGSLNNVFQHFDAQYCVEDFGLHTTVFGRQTYLSKSIRTAQIPIQEEWVKLGTQSGWERTSDSFQRVQFTINRSTQEVLLRGEIGGGGAGSPIGTLPAGYRPNRRCTFLCPGTRLQEYAIVAVTDAGVVHHVAGCTTSIDLGSIRFFTS